MRQIFDEVQKISKCGWFDMPFRSTFEIGTQIILSKIDGFLKGWILNITPPKGLISVAQNCCHQSVHFTELAQLPGERVNYFRP